MGPKESVLSSIGEYIVACEKTHGESGPILKDLRGSALARDGFIRWVASLVMKTSSARLGMAGVSSHNEDIDYRNRQHESPGDNQDVDNAA